MRKRSRRLKAGLSSPAKKKVTIPNRCLDFSQFSDLEGKARSLGGTAHITVTGIHGSIYNTVAYPYFSQRDLWPFTRVTIHWGLGSTQTFVSAAGCRAHSSTDSWGVKLLSGPLVRLGGPWGLVIKWYLGLGPAHDGSTGSVNSPPSSHFLVLKCIIGIFILGS